MRKKKNTFAQKYILWTTKKPLFFYSFLLAGTALFLWLTLTTRIETDKGLQTLLYLIFVRAGNGL
jgi:prolipoprotein diacylglyceryltransferase